MGEAWVDTQIDGGQKTGRVDGQNFRTKRG